jgi:tetratricopeptide (TPR) repeat protein
MSHSDQALQKKDAGNEAYRAGDYSRACALFTEAISLDPTNETFYCNRSMCHAAMQNWRDSIIDAQEAISLSEKYVKAHFRLVKGLLQVKNYKDARIRLLNAINLCGDSKDLRVLDEEITATTGVPVRPKPNDFDIVEELGEGNFSKIFKAIYKPTQRTYAVKVGLLRHYLRLLEF